MHAARLALAASVLLLMAPARGAENLIYNGDFELAAGESPPPGWTMWGAQRYKDPANFTRDTANPHGGQACFRIHHPADTAGYIVSSPDRAIRPRRGMSYSVTFWARAEGPVSAVFGFTAYRSIQPFEDAPSPGFFPIEVGRDWRRYSFAIDEGWDFFADRSRYLLLTFKATTEAGLATTVWVDDVAVTEAPSTREGRLLDPDTLAYTPLEHRLKPGTELAFTVDADKRLRRATRDAGGVSFHRVAGWSGVPYDREGRYTLDPQLEAAVREMHLPMTRFYALGDEPFGLEAAIDKAADFLGRIGVAQGRTVLEFEIQGATKTLPPETWARGVRHSLAKGYGFHDWEITNEPYVGRSNRAFPDADDYLRHFLAVSRAVRQADPDARIGLPIARDSHKWGNCLLKQAAGHYDFVVGHYYCFVDVAKSKFEDVVLAANFATLDTILKINALIRAYNPGRDVTQRDTEWGMHSSGPNGERPDYLNRNANIVGTLHRAVRLIYYAREDILRGASSWEMFTRLRAPGFAFLAQEAPDRRSMLYWLYYFFNRHVGEWVVAMDGTAPWYEGSARGQKLAGPLTPVLATLSKDETKLYLVAANGSWSTAVPCRVSLRGFAAARATGVVLSQSDPDASPFLDRREDAVGELPVTLGGGELKCTLPAHSVAFITVEKAE